MFAVLNAIEGGSDTTRATLNVFVAAMATDPEFLGRVRKELDAVCGDAKRLPRFEDQAKLPLVTACVKEVLRWYPLVAAGVVRVLIQDDQFEEYYFPKGTRFSISLSSLI
jgi:cytochrome P450